MQPCNTRPSGLASRHAANEDASPWGFIYGISLNYTVHILINTQTGALGGLEGMVCGEAPYIYRGGGGENRGMMGGDN